MTSKYGDPTAFINKVRQQCGRPLVVHAASEEDDDCYDAMRRHNERYVNPNLDDPDPETGSEFVAR